jgi:hypothetical protein
VQPTGGGRCWTLAEILADESIENVEVSGPDVVVIRSDGSTARLAMSAEGM